MFRAVRNFNLYTNFYRKSLENSATFKLVETESNYNAMTTILPCTITKYKNNFKQALEALSNLNNNHTTLLEGADAVNSFY